MSECSNLNWTEVVAILGVLCFFAFIAWIGTRGGDK